MPPEPIDVQTLKTLQRIERLITQYLDETFGKVKGATQYAEGVEEHHNVKRGRRK